MNPECNIITLGFTPRCCYLFNLGLNPDIKISTVGFKPSLTAGLNDLTSFRKRFFKRAAVPVGLEKLFLVISPLTVFLPNNFKLLDEKKY